MIKQQEAHAAIARVHRHIADLYTQLSKPARTTVELAKRPEIRSQLQKAQADLRDAEAHLKKVR